MFLHQRFLSVLAATLPRKKKKEKKSDFTYVLWGQCAPRDLPGFSWEKKHQKFGKNERTVEHFNKWQIVVFKKQKVEIVQELSFKYYLVVPQKRYLVFVNQRI